MLRTSFCELLDIEVPLVQAPIWPATTPELVAAVSEAGALGSLAAVMGPPGELHERIARIRELTDRPFAVNHVVPRLDAEAFEATLEAAPAVISFALGDPGDHVDRAHSAGAKVMEQIHTVDQARQAADRGVDVIIAQGGEAGGQGFSGGVGVMALVPQVVDAVAPIPVLAAGGIADGRGLAASTVLGGAGANVGTRFIASEEAGASEAWKGQVVEAGSDDTMRFEPWRVIMVLGETSYDVVPRVIRTRFVAEWEDRPEEAAEQAERLSEEIMASVAEGRQHEFLPFTGESAGLVHDVLPAAEIVRRMAAEAEEALTRAGALVHG